MNKKDLLDKLIARAEQSKEAKVKVMEFTTETLGDVKVVIPETKKLLGLIDDAQDCETMYEQTLVDAEIVYSAIPAIKEILPELKKAYDESDPAVIVFRLFEDASAIGELNDLSAKIIAAVGFGKKAVKN
ncbi:MAG: hypothetical protein RSA49_04275 [Anaerovoracaceae bacterium]|uniref:hypothetical protein n=1 Tax=Chryseobacterium sp. TaxID=1871047 RepID=UPI002FC6D9EE